MAVEFGQAGDLPVVGDWTGDGISKLGVYRDGKFYSRHEQQPPDRRHRQGLRAGPRGRQTGVGRLERRRRRQSRRLRRRRPGQRPVAGVAAIEPRKGAKGSGIFDFGPKSRCTPTVSAIRQGDKPYRYEHGENNNRPRQPAPWPCFVGSSHNQQCVKQVVSVVNASILHGQHPAIKMGKPSCFPPPG